VTGLDVIPSSCVIQVGGEIVVGDELSTFSLLEVFDEFDQSHDRHEEN
jgi:hypothetical protein